MSSPFPFHGIFSSLGNTGDDVSRAEQAPTRRVTPAPPSFQDPQTTQASSGTGVGQVAVDIYEQDDHYIIKAAIAGVHLNDIDIEISDNSVTIRGTRRQSDPIGEDQYFLKECFWGEFSRTVQLPISIDPRKVRATLNKECILQVIIPKEQEKVKVVRIGDA